MPTFEKTIFTNLGISFLNDLNSGRIKLANAKTAYSTTDLSGMSDDDIRNMSDIDSKDITVPCDIVRLDNHQTKIRSVANNEGLKQGIYIRSYATYFTDEQGNQTLFGIKVNTKPQYLVAFDGVNTNSQSYGFNVGVSQTDNIQFTKLSNLAATVQDLKDKFDPLDAQLNEFTVHDSYSGTDMFGIPRGIWRLTNNTMINTPFGDNVPITGTVINYGDYTTYVDHQGETFVTSPQSKGWQQYANQSDIKSLTNTTSSIQSQLNEFTVHDSYSGTDMFGIPRGIWRLTNNTMINTPFGDNVPITGTVINYGDYTTYVDHQGETFVTSPQSKGWHQYADQAETVANSNAIVQLASSANASIASVATSTSNIQEQINGFTLHDSSDVTDMYAFPPGIWRLTNHIMTNTPFGDGTPITGTIINYGWYTTYVDRQGFMFVTSPDSYGWVQYGRKNDIDNALKQAEYNVVAELNDSDDILKLTQNGHYVASGTNPANNPWQKNIWADVYKTDYNIVIRDNIGHEFIRSNYDNAWRRTLSDLDIASLPTNNSLNVASQTDIINLQTQINAINSALNGFSVRELNAGEDLYSLEQGFYSASNVVLKNAPYTGPCTGSAIRVGRITIYSDWGGSTFVVGGNSNGWKQL